MQQDWVLEGGWSKGSESLTPQPADTSRCTKSSHPKEFSWRRSFPLPWFPLQKSSGRSPQFPSSGITPCVLLLYVRGISSMSGLYAKARSYPMLLQRNSSLVTCIQQAWLEPQPWEKPPPRKPVCAVCYLSVFPSGAAAWIEQGRGLILLPLQEFNWKGIVFNLISSLVSAQA